MKSRLYRHKHTNKIYIVESTKPHGYITLLCTHFPYSRTNMRKALVKKQYKPITMEDS